MDTALLAAAIAAVASIIAACVSWFAAFQGRRARDRDHAWERLTWAMRSNRDQAEYDISRTVLRQLETVAWVPPDDRRTARTLRTTALRSCLRPPGTSVPTTPPDSDDGTPS